MAQYTVTFNSEEFQNLRELLNPLDGFARLFIAEEDFVELGSLHPGEVLEETLWMNIWESPKGPWRISITYRKNNVKGSIQREISLREFIAFTKGAHESSDLRPGQHNDSGG